MRADSVSSWLVPGFMTKAALPPGPPPAKPQGAVVSRILRKGDIYRIVGAGGGGWGDPATRDPALEAHDKTEGYVTAEAAE